MKYVATSNYYLWYGLKLLLEDDGNDCLCGILKNKAEMELSARISGSKSQQAIRTQFLMLTAREQRIARMSLSGAHIEDISSVLGLKTKTVYSHQLKVCKKMKVRKIRDLIKYQHVLTEC